MTTAELDEQEVRRRAIAWYAHMCSGEASEADHAELQAWLAQRAEHRQAWARLAAVSQSLQGVPANIAMPALRGVRRTRRAVLRGIVVLASTGTAAYLSYRAVEQPGLYQPWLAQYRTGVGERRVITLADGSRLVLNTDSAADVDFSDSTRTIALWRGEALIETAAHRGLGKDARPLLVETGQGTVRALGTRFTVRVLGAHTRAAVFNDAVEVRTGAGSAMVLRAGQATSFSSTAIDAIHAVDDSAIQWEHGSLLVGNARLGDVIAELARYRRGHLACDDAVAGIRVSGAFPIDDTDQALTILLQSFPLRLTSVSRYWVVVGAA